MDGRDRGLQLEGTYLALGQGLLHEQGALGDAFASQRLRSCSASGTSDPSPAMRAARRASVSSISASSPLTSPSWGSKACSRRVSRIASWASTGSSRPGPVVLVCPSVKTR